MVVAMLKRTLSGAVLILIAFFSFWLGGYVLFGVTLALSLIGMFELFRVFNMHKTVQAGIGYLGVVLYFV